MIPEELKLSGKRSADHAIGLYLRSRQVCESEREHRVTPLHGVIHTTSPSCRLGVMAKVVSNRVGFGAFVVSGVAWMATVMLSELDGHGQVFQTDPIQQAHLPSGYHAFQILLPTDCLPSIQLSVSGCFLKWYVFVEDVSLRSNVVLAIQRLYIADPIRSKSITGSAGQSTRASLELKARLGNSCYQCKGDLLSIHVQVDNPNNISCNGFKITVKQLLTVTVQSVRDGQRVVTRTIKRCIATRVIKQPIKDTVKDTLDILLDPTTIGDVFTTNCRHFSPSFSNLSLPVGSNQKRLTCSLEYYVNVHIVLPWSANLIVSLPFTMVLDEMVTEPIELDEKTTVHDNTLVQSQMAIKPPDNLTPLPYSQDLQQALEDMDTIESLRRRRQPLPNSTTASLQDTITAFKSMTISLLLKDVDPLAPAGHSEYLSVNARRLVRLAATRGEAAWDAVRVLLWRCSRDDLTMQQLDDALNRVQRHLL